MRLNPLANRGVWIGEALTNALRKDMLRWKPFEGYYESTIVETLLVPLLRDAGWLPLLEQLVYPHCNDRADVWIEACPTSPAWLIEAKVIWDGHDKRLNRSRFLFDREILKDLERLAQFHDRNTDRNAVWVTFSPSSDVRNAPQGSQTLRYGDVLKIVKDRCPMAVQVFSEMIDCQSGLCRDYARFAHITVWGFE